MFKDLPEFVFGIVIFSFGFLFTNLFIDHDVNSILEKIQHGNKICEKNGGVIYYDHWTFICKDGAEFSVDN